RIRLAKDRQHWEVRDATDRPDEDEEIPKPLLIKSERKLCGLHAAVRQQVHHLETLGRPEGERALDHDTANEQRDAARDGPQRQRERCRGPMKVEAPRSDDGDDEPLREPAGAIETKIVADQLKRRGAWTKQDAIEVAGLDELRTEHVEPATEKIGDREADADETEEHRDVAETPAVDRAEASEQHPDRNQVDDRRHELANGD